MITIFYIIETILIYSYSLGLSLNARPHKRQRFNHHGVEIKVVVLCCESPSQGALVCFFQCPFHVSFHSLPLRNCHWVTFNFYLFFIQLYQKLITKLSGSYMYSTRTIELNIIKDYKALVSQAKMSLNWHINNITAKWINNNYILLTYLQNLQKNYTVLQLDPANSNSVISNSLAVIWNSKPYPLDFPFIQYYWLFRTTGMFCSPEGSK